ncbi:rho GTPase-activating protein 15-like isoform X3 [Nycticebus coucang]|uniref:rho GTPase-activating protein 15-like isoform X3 n=1 Tax=Nycticebus coucang TaxID=9470 RepID=UPI00234CCF8E|nr:rho GTPase-activating protein 15-like isoform X3 [Nycticebus coucang]
MVEKEGYLQKAKIADGGKKLRKNWSTSWIVLSSRKIEFYKESKQQALSNTMPGNSVSERYLQNKVEQQHCRTKTGHKAESVDLYGAHIEWAKEKSSRKNVFQMVEKEGYLQKAKIADGGKKLRKNWSTSWIVLSSRKIEFYKESKQQALSNTWES